MAGSVGPRTLTSIDRSFDFPPLLSTRRQDWKPRTKTRQCCADIRSPRAAKRVIFQAWVRGESAGTQSSSAAESTSDEQQRQYEDAGAIDAHQGENDGSGAGAVVEEFQFSRRYAVDLDLLSKSLQQNLLVDKHALQRASFAEDVRKVGQVWPCQVNVTSISSALHADWKTNALHHQGYIAKWYVRTVCSHRHSSGGIGSCMAPTVVNLF